MKSTRSPTSILIEEILTYLAVEGNVAAATQNQAPKAILSVFGNLPRNKNLIDLFL
jgi:hypothetical protein